MSRKKKVLIAGLAAVVLMAGLTVYVSFSHAGGKPLTIAELKAQGHSDAGSSVSVKGEVEHGSIDWDPQGQIMRFSLVDGQDALSVVYRGVVRDSFESGAGVAIEGRYTDAGVFEAVGFSSTGSFLCNACHH